MSQPENDIQGRRIESRSNATIRVGMLGADVGKEIDVACENRVDGKAAQIFAWSSQSFTHAVTRLERPLQTN
jgi:hypothetical protein